jgi:hypothetical protein
VWDWGWEGYSQERIEEKEFRLRNQAQMSKAK